MKFPKKKPYRSKETYRKYGLRYPDCQACKGMAVDVHHIIFKSQGGGDTIENLISLCRECHLGAHGVDKERWEDVFKRIKNTIDE
tara:strand:- start:78 stop:332 length:255 start_codon:yes stop_codon:yes gene_type:complete